MTNFENILITEDMSVENAMQIIENGGCKSAFLLKDGILCGVITDGDIRRYILKNKDIHDSVVGAVNYEPRFLYLNECKDSQSFMFKNFLTALPIVDENKRVIRIDRLINTYNIKKIGEDVSVIMMAGGKGTRLKPYTDIIPKPLIPIGEKTITEHILDRFVKYGCERLYMVLNYKRELIKAYFKDINTYNHLSFVEESFFMGTAGGLSLLNNISEENFFLVNCDILINADFYEIWNEHKSKENIITMICARKKIVVPYGAVETSEDGKVLALKEKPVIEYNINTGMYVCNKQIFSYIGENEVLDMPDLIQRCIDKGLRVGWIMIDEEDWYDMGQIDELEKMQKRLGMV